MTIYRDALVYCIGGINRLETLGGLDQYNLR